MREWTAWFEHYNKLNSYEKICENFIQFLETENTIKNQLIQLEESRHTFRVKVVIDEKSTTQPGQLIECNHLKEQVHEHLEVLKMLHLVLSDIQSYKSCLKRYFLRLKRKYYEDNMSFTNVFKDDNVFNSLERSQALPGTAKKEIALIKRQLDVIIPNLDDDIKYLLEKTNKAFVLNA